VRHLLQLLLLLLLILVVSPSSASMIVDNPIIASDVRLIGLLGHGATFRKSNPSETKGEGNTLVREIGNITAEADMTLEYGIRDQKMAEEVVSSTKLFFLFVAHSSLQLTLFSSLFSVQLKKEKMPLQLHIFYTKKDKSKYLRVVSAMLTVTKDRALAEKDCNVSIIALNAVQQSAKIAQKGDYALARHDLLAVQRLLQRCAETIVQKEEYGNFVTWSEDLDTALINLQQRGGGRMDDATAKTLQRMKTIQKSWFLAGSKKEEIVAKRKKHTEPKKEN
jgi:hypothetical protein